MLKPCSNKLKNFCKLDLNTVYSNPMKIHEYQTKYLFKEEGIPVLPGDLAETPEKAYEIATQLKGVVAVKAQVHVGGRGKAGGIKIAKSPDEAKSYAQSLIGMDLKGLTVKKLWIESGAQIEKELYLGIVLDRMQKRNVILFTPEGGVDVEELAEKRPEALLKLPLDPLTGITDTQMNQLLSFSRLDIQLHPQLSEIVSKLVRLFLKYDGELLEINPLVVTNSNQLIALDGKLNVDDNALFRQDKIRSFAEIEEMDPLELEASKRGLAYVRLNGNVGIIGNGAGLVMGTMDEVQRAGGKPANFCDLGGGAKADVVRNALEILLMDSNIKGLLINIFGGITRGDEVAKGLISVIKEKGIELPIVVRLEGTRAEEGLAILAEANLISAHSMQDGAAKIVKLVNER